jgi:hypothetical protein
MTDSGLTPVSDDLNMGATIRGYVAGQKLFDRYTLEQMLGRGGMGIVWLAKDESLEQHVALKFLPETLRLDTSSLDDLKRETRRGLALAHPHIVRIYDFIDDSTAAAISMEYVDGRTLSALRIEQAGRVFQTAQLHDWVTQLVEALDYAHRRAKIVHRDLKPANLMTNLSGELKVADFGIARSISDSVSRVSVKGASSGTLVYMSPQQAQGMPTKASDDIYAVGATLYELITSKPPFFSGNIQHQLDSVVAPSMTQRRIDLEIEGDEIPAEWENTVAACLAKDPADRPQSIAHIGELLGLRSATATSFATATVPMAARAQPFRAKSPTAPYLENKWLIGAGAAIALLIVGGLGYYFGVAVPAEKARQAQLAQAQAAAEEQARLEADKQQAAAAAAAAQLAQQKVDEEKAAAEKSQEAAAQLAAAQQAAKDAQAAADQKAQQLAAQQAAAAAAAAAVPVPPPITPEQIAHEKEVGAQVQALIDAKKFGAALYHLELLTSTMDKDRAAAITAPFQNALGAYQQQRDAAISASLNGDPATAMAQLQAFDTANPGDPKIALATASVQTRMPPDATALKDELKTLRALSTEDAVVRTDPNFLALQTKFTNELHQLQALSGRLDELKSAPHGRGGVARLEAERTDAQKKLQSYQIAAQNPLIAFGVAASIQDKQREIASLTEKINDIQSEPIASQAEIDDAQQKYDDFMAAVPW